MDSSAVPDIDANRDGLAAAKKKISVLMRSSSERKMAKLGGKTSLVKSSSKRLIAKLSRKENDAAVDSNQIDCEAAEELERLEIVRQSEEAGRQVIISHLRDFRKRKGGNSSYESWVASLHPENVGYEVPAELLEAAQMAESETGEKREDGDSPTRVGTKTIDNRFYVDESHHRRLWNESLKEGIADPRYVHPKTSIRGSVLRDK